MAMTNSPYDALLATLCENDAGEFQAIVIGDGLPGGNFDKNLLIKALEMYNKPIVNVLLDNMKNCNTNALNAAVKNTGWYDVVERILEKGARVTDTDCNGNTALHLAFLKDAPDCTIELLLNRFLMETIVDIKNESGIGCLHIASAKASMDSVKRSLTIADVNYQVSPNSVSFYAGYSPLHFAVVNDRPDVVDLLCQNNADVYIKNRRGSTPIHLALECCKIAIIDILFEYDKKHENCVNGYNLTHFMAACVSTNPLIVEQYILAAENNFSISLENMITSQVFEFGQHPFAGYTPIRFAIEFCRLKTFNLLLDRGAYCKLEKLFPININCNMRRGLIFSLIRHHYNMCPNCCKINFVYKRLACSNNGIQYLIGINRNECTNSTCIKISLILLVVFVVLIITICLLQYSTSTTTY